MGINVFILEHELKPSAMLSFVIGFAACQSKNCRRSISKIRNISIHFFLNTDLSDFADVLSCFVSPYSR